MISKTLLPHLGTRIMIIFYSVSLVDHNSHVTLSTGNIREKLHQFVEVQFSLASEVT